MSSLEVPSQEWVSVSGGEQGHSLVAGLGLCRLDQSQEGVVVVLSMEHPWPLSDQVALLACSDREIPSARS